MLLLLRSLLEVGGVEPPVVVPTFSNEIELRPWYVKRGKQIHLFNSAREADAFLEAEEQAQEAIEKAKSSRAKRRVRRRVYELVEHKTVDIDLLGSLAAQYAIPVDIPQLLKAQDWDGLARIALNALQLQEDEDVNLILESENQEQEQNLADIYMLVQAGAFKSLAAELNYSKPVKAEKPVKVDRNAMNRENMTKSLSATMAVVMAAIENINKPKSVVRDAAGRISGVI